MTHRGVNLGITVFEIFIWEVYRLIFGRKFSFTATRERRRKRDFRPYTRRYTTPNENFEYGYPHSNAFLQFRLKLERSDDM